MQHLTNDFFFTLNLLHGMPNHKCWVIIICCFQWLKQLGPIVTNYGALTMKFIHDGASIMLRAGVPSLPEEVSPNRLNVSFKLSPLLLSIIEPLQPHNLLLHHLPSPTKYRSLLPCFRNTRSFFNPPLSSHHPDKSPTKSIFYQTPISWAFVRIGTLTFRKLRSRNRLWKC